jgi:hypothetical protein
MVFISSAVKVILPAPKLLLILSGVIDYYRTFSNQISFIKMTELLLPKNNKKVEKKSVLTFGITLCPESTPQARIAAQGSQVCALAMSVMHGSFLSSELPDPSLYYGPQWK